MSQCRRHLAPIAARLTAVALFVIGMTFEVRAQTPPSPHHPGQWTSATPWPGRTSFTNSVYAVHVALMRGDTLFARPHSQVMTWGNWDATWSDGGLWGWNPTTDSPVLAGSNLTPRSVPNPPYWVFCAGHAALPDGGLLILSGTERGHTGERRSARFNAITRQWTQSPMQAERWYGNVTPMADGRMLATGGWKYDHMVAFGGRRASDGALVSDVQRLGITNAGTWDAALGGSGPLWPAPREAHTLADLKNGPYYLFGGKDATGNTVRDVWQLRTLDNDITQTYRWRQIVPSNPTDIQTRWRHAAVVVPSTPDSLSTMLVFSGERIVGATATTLADLWKLEWRTDAPGNRWQWSDLTASSIGDIPTARSGHSAFWDSPNNRMVLYGGQDAAGAISDNSIYVLRLPSGVPTWKRAPLKSGSPLPSARTRHAMAANPKSGISTGVLFGGQTTAGLVSELWEFTIHPVTDSVTWFLRAAGGTGPAPRTDAAIIGYELYPTSYLVLGGVSATGVGDATPWEYRFGSGWNALATGATALKGVAAIREERVLTALQPEVFDPSANAWTAFGQSKYRSSFHMNFMASDGRFYSPGPNFFGKDSTWRFDPSLGTWTLYAVNNTAPLDGTIGGILYRPDQIMKCSGLGLFERGATKSLLTGLAPLAPTWRNSVNSMGRARQNQILSMLPTGEVIVTGGQGLADNGNGDPDDDLPCKNPEIWDPDVYPGHLDRLLVRCRHDARERPARPGTCHARVSLQYDPAARRAADLGRRARRTSGVGVPERGPIQPALPVPPRRQRGLPSAPQRGAGPHHLGSGLQGHLPGRHRVRVPDPPRGRDALVQSGLPLRSAEHRLADRTSGHTPFTSQREPCAPGQLLAIRSA